MILDVNHKKKKKFYRMALYKKIINNFYLIIIKIMKIMNTMNTMKIKEIMKIMKIMKTMKIMKINRITQEFHMKI